MISVLKLRELMGARIAESENAHNRGKYHCTAYLLFDWFGFDQRSKADANSTLAKELNQTK